MLKNSFKAEKLIPNIKEFKLFFNKYDVKYAPK